MGPVFLGGLVKIEERTECAWYINGNRSHLVTTDQALKVKDNKHKNENYEDYWSGSTLKLPSVVRHQLYGYRDRFPGLMEEMAVTVKNDGCRDNWRLL